MKHEWRKKEKGTYLPKHAPEIIEVPTYKFLTISGAGNPNSDTFPDYISALYSLSYAIKMNLKKRPAPSGYSDYTVYPLEGIWDLNEAARKAYTGTLNKDDLVFQLMIRQPNFVEDAFVEEMMDLTAKKKPHRLLHEVKFEELTEGKCIQMMHLGRFEDEPASFARMETFAEEKGLLRKCKTHREIYLTDFRKTAPEKLKTVLRFKVTDA